MIQILGYLFLAILISVGIVSGDYLLPGDFLGTFLKNDFIPTFGGLVGLNIAAVIFLLGQLTAVEANKGELNLFQGTKSEIKHNSYLLLTSFLICTVLLILQPDLKEDASFYLNYEYYAIKFLVVFLYSLALFSVFEILNAVFLLGRSVK